MEISIRQEKTCTVVTVAGRLDTGAIQEFEQNTKAMGTKGSGKTVLDLGGLDYIASSGLRSLLGLKKSLQGEGCGLAICGLRGFPREVFQVSGFEMVFPLYDDVASAVKGLESD